MSTLIYPGKGAGPAGSVSSVTTRRDAKKLEKERRIRQAAAELFSERGYEGTTTRDIAARAGIATGTLFLYVRDKDEALALVFHDRVESMLADRVRTIPTRARMERRLLHVFTGFFELYAQDPSLSLRFAQRIPVLDAATRGAHETVNARIVEVVRREIQRGIDRAELRADHDVELAVANVFAIFRVRVFGWLVEGGRDLATGVAGLGRALGQLLDGIRVR